MSRITISRGKFNHLQACANEQGVISALAVDQRGSLRKSFTQFRPELASDEEMTLFKHAVSRVLSSHASAILVDPEYGLAAIRDRAACLCLRFLRSREPPST